MSFHTFTLQTAARELHDITAQVERIVTEQGLRHGICVVSIPHTTAGVTINENADPAVKRDVLWKLDRLIPAVDDYRHAEGNSHAHLQAILTGFSVTAPVVDGKLVLGTWQGIYFAEYDGPRTRTVQVTLLAG